MDKNVANLYASFAKVKKFDIRWKRKRYNDACEKLAECLASVLFPSDHIKFYFLNGCICYDSKPLMQIDSTLFGCDDLQVFQKKLEGYKNKFFRTFVNYAFFECEVSDSPLVNIGIESFKSLELDYTKITTRSTKIRENIEKRSGRPLIVYGNSSSGKTVAVAQAVSQLIVNSYSCTWVDLVDVNVEVEHLLYAIFQSINKSKHIIVIDNVQAYPSKIGWIKLVVDRVKTICTNIDIKVVNICWRSARKTIERMYLPTPVEKIECHGDDIIVELVRAYSLDKYEKEILTNSAGDVLIAKSMLDFLTQHKRFPSERQISQTIYEKCTKKKSLSVEAQKVLYVVAALGEFEIHVRQEYLQNISRNGFDELSTNNVFRKYKTEDSGTYIAVGHRSLAHKVLLHLRETVEDVQGPVELAIAYLTIEGKKQILSTLERLDLELEIGDSIFANLWQAFGNMRASLIKQLSVDSTWGNNMASMIFAAEALANIRFDNDSTTLWEITASNIRKRWCPDQNNGVRFIGEVEGIQKTTEIIDFVDNIRKTMREDELSYSYSENMLSENIDYQRFHNNWLLGLLLGFEGIALDEEDLKLEYIKCAESVQQSNGAFYPERVCWVTARVVMGLCQCGLSYSDTVVKKACNWLVSQLTCKDEMQWSIEALECDGWRSGTGIWNSNEQITLMCLCALFAAQYPIRKNEKVSNVVHEIWRCRKNLEKSFIEKGTILDIMWIIDVMLYDNRNPIDLKEEIKYLTDYVLKKWNDASLLSSEKETESSDVSFMSKEIIVIVWALLNKNLEQLLKGLELDYSISKETKKIFISYRREEGGGSAFAQDLYRALDKHFKNEVFLDVYDLREESRDFSEVIENAICGSKVVIAVVTDHSFERACYQNYDNDSDVYYKELSTALTDGKDVITIYNSSLRRPELPDELRVNESFYDVAVRLAKKNAAFYDSTVPDAMERLTSDVVRKIKYLNI